MSPIVICLDSYDFLKDGQEVVFDHVYLNVACIGTMIRKHDKYAAKYTAIQYAVGNSCCKLEVKQTPDEILALIKKETDARIPAYTATLQDFHYGIERR